MRRKIGIACLLASVALSMVAVWRASCICSSGAYAQDEQLLSGVESNLWLHTSTYVTQCLNAEERMICVEIGTDVYAIDDDRSIPNGERVDVAISFDKDLNHSNRYSIVAIEILD